ncbi:MAG: DUF4838 domain-containing protein [Armatimonadetes bacterium]|nr:DUF4838 domain-containing protein [Armatimonadota bacterium]
MDTRLCLCALALLIAALSATSAEAGITLVKEGRSPYRIVVPRDAIASERHAANELQAFLKQICGATLPIIEDRGPLPPRAILLGNNAYLERVKAGVDFARLGQEGFTIRTVGPHLVIAGGRPRGTLYGVYTFLEEELGCRWFTPKVSRIPRQETIRLGDLDNTQVPRLEYREPFWFDAYDGDWAARNKANSSSARLEEKHGGKIVYEGFVHTFNTLVPPERYYDEHPEYFSEINGKRMKGYYQLCLTNPDVLRITIEGVKEWLKKNPKANIVSVSQNDTGGWCQCANCLKVEEEEGGAHSGPLIRFVNAVAEAIEAEYPHVAIDTLAYQYTRKPCKTRPRPNVIVRLCSIECCFSHPLEEEDTSFKEDIIGWSKLCDRVYIWDYTTTFAHYVLPFSNIEVLQPNVQFFVKHGVKGIFEQGAYQSPGGADAWLKAYLQAKILWDPDCDVERHRWEFMQGVYGKAAGPVDRYLRLMRWHVLDNNIHQPIWIGPESGQAPPELIAKANALFDEAEKLVADDPETLHRVQVARLPIQYVQLTRARVDASKPWTIVGDTYGPGDSPLAKTADQFFAVCAKEKITHLNEGGLHPDKLREQVAPRIYGAKVITLENAALRLRVAPSLGGRILTVEQKAGNRSLIPLPAPNTPGFPAVGGYWESAGFGRGAPGAIQAFQVEGQPAADSVTLTADLGGGLTLRRVIRLTEEAGWRVESTLTNNGEAARPARLRTTLELALGGENVTLEAGGEQMALRIPDDATTATTALAGQTTAESGWTLTGPAGFAVRCQVEGEVLRTLFMNRAVGPTLGVQVLTPEQTLQPKASLSLAATYTVLPAPETEAVKREHTAQIVEVEQDDFSLYREGELSGVRDDPTAADGFAAWMGGNHNEWAIQWPIDHSRLEEGATYEVSAVVRFETKGTSGGAITYGVYGVDTRATLCNGGVSAADARDEWQTVVLGRLKPTGNQYVWLAPTNNAGNIGAVYVDKLILRKVE